MIRDLLALAALVLLAAPVAALVPRAGDDEPAAGARGGEQDDEPREDLSVTEHTVVVEGVAVAYTATAGTLPLLLEDGTKKADVFFVAYTRDGVDEPAARPLTFSFNGGPGSSSVWLHLGAFGPRRVPMPEQPGLPPPPYGLVDNGASLIDVTDLVFIDPVTTGYSRTVPGEDDDQYHGVTQDIEAVGEFIRLYTTRFERWPSPKFLAGESYGTLRAAGLAGHLQDRHGMYLNGVVLVSSILEYLTARFDDGNDLPYPLFLPSYTATAWYHGRLAPELQDDLEATLDRARAFALDEYLPALAHGARLGDEERARVRARLSRFTGLSETFLEQVGLRPTIGQFAKELRRDEGLTVGRLDARFTGRDREGSGDRYDYDSSYAAILGPYTAALNDYVRAELGYESDLPYEILTGRVHPWDFGRGNSYANTAETLRAAMTRNPHLRVFVANGYYDLATPFFATEYTFAHMQLAPELRDHVTMRYYPAGHMMYVHEPSLHALKADLAAFLEAAVPAR